MAFPDWNPNSNYEEQIFNALKYMYQNQQCCWPETTVMKVESVTAANLAAAQAAVQANLSADSDNVLTHIAMSQTDAGIINVLLFKKPK